MTDTRPSADTRAQIAAFLPAALMRAIDSYEIYTESIDHEKSTEFSEYHKNAKIALAHIELLLKLAKWAELNDSVVAQALEVFGPEALQEYDGFKHDENK